MDLRTRDPPTPLKSWLLAFLLRCTHKSGVVYETGFYPTLTLPFTRGGNWISGFPPLQGGIEGGNLTCVYTVALYGRRLERGFLNSVKSKPLWQPRNYRLPGFGICPISTVGTGKRLSTIHYNILHSIRENFLTNVTEKIP